MALTYSQLPISVSDVFESIVSTVALNLLTEISVSVPSINFHCETWVELQSRLISEGKDSETKGVRFPLVALIRNFDKSFDANDDRFNSELTLIIVTQSDATMLSEDRITTNFIPTLRPIEAELFAVIKTSPYFSGYNSSSPSYTSYESFNLGSNDAKSYKLPEHLDGIIIDKLKLRFNPIMQTFARQGPTKTLSYLNNVSKITAQYVSGVFRIGFAEAQYSGLGTPVYTLFTSHDENSYTVTVASSQIINVAGYTGEYFGSIHSNDGYTTSILYFFYKIVNGVVTKYTSLVVFKLQNFTLTGFTTPYYPFEIKTQITANKDVVKQLVIKQGVSVGPEIYTTLETANFTPSTDDTTEITYSETLEQITDYRCIGMDVSFDTANNTTTEQSSVSYYKLT